MFSSADSLLIYLFGIECEKHYWEKSEFSNIRLNCYPNSWLRGGYIIYTNPLSITRTELKEFQTNSDYIAVAELPNGNNRNDRSYSPPREFDPVKLQILRIPGANR